MTQIRSLYSLFLLIAFSSIGYAQPVFITSESNVDQTVTEIFELYEDQIDLNYDQVHLFVTNIVMGAEPEACKNPYPKIRSVEQGSIDFFWDQITDAEYYQANVLNLNSGATAYAETPVPNINFSGQKGLILFGFNTICQNSAKSGTGIIIVDVEILFPVPPEENNCECELMASLPFSPGASTSQQAFSIFWPSDPKCANSKYNIRVDGDLDNGSSPSTPYSSEITFIHGKATTPNVVWLLPKCDINALSSASPLRAGGLDFPGSGLPYYNTSFTHSYLTLTIPPSDLDIKDLFVDICTCKGKDKGKRAGSRNVETDNTFQYFALAPNPSSDRVQLTLGLEPSKELKIEVYDLLGKRIETLTRKNQTASSQYSIDIDVQSWPVGLYSFHLSSANHNKVLFFSKN